MPLVRREMRKLICLTSVQLSEAVDYLMDRIAARANGLLLRKLQLPDPSLLDRNVDRVRCQCRRQSMALLYFSFSSD